METQTVPQMGQIIAKAWADEEFRRALTTDATAALKSEGVDVPEGLNVRVLQNTETTTYYVLPVPPSAHLDAADVADAARGGVESMCCSCKEE